MKRSEISYNLRVFGIFIVLYACYLNAIKSISLPFIVTLVISLCLFLLNYFLSKNKKLNINLGFLLVVLMFIFSILYTKTFQSSFRMIITYVLLLLVSLFLDYDDIFCKKIINCLLIFSCVSLGITIISFISSNFYIDYILPHVYEASQEPMYNLVIYAHSFPGIFASTGLNAFFLSIGYFIVFINIIVFNKNKKCNYFLLFLFVLGIFLTLKRIALFLDFIITFVILHYANKMNKSLYIRKKNNSVYLYINKKLLKRIIFMLILCGIFIICFQDVILNLITRIFSSNDVMNGRTELYNFAFQKIYLNPFIGNGINSFPVLYGNSLSTHNEFIQLTYELGIIQSIFITIWLVTNLVNTLRFLMNLKLDGYLNDRKYSFLLLSIAIQTYFIMYCFTGNPFHDMNVFGIYIIMVTISLNLRKEYKKWKIK